MVMGILNVTPDSFSDGGAYEDPQQAVSHARQMIQAGARIIDVGGESTRPGSTPIGVAEELKRVIPVIRALSAEDSCLISIDTQKSEVAQAAIDNGAHIVNDISAGRNDESMLKVVARNNAIYIMMHMQGKPQSMQVDPQYYEVVSEIKEFFKCQIEQAVIQGVKRSQIVLDPGIGFGKTLENNLDILANIDQFHSFGCPLLLGASRKSFIDMLHPSEVHERTGGSIGAVLSAYLNNVQIYRVHDVFETMQALHIFTAIQKHLD